jgi:hypothetical protein
MFERAKTVLSASKAAAVVSARQLHDANAARYQDVAASYRALHDAYRRREEFVRRRRGRPYRLAAFQKFCS